MSGGLTIKKVFSQYLKKWCGRRGTELRIDDQETFVAETEGMFEMVLYRIADEREKLIPLVRRLLAIEFR